MNCVVTRGLSDGRLWMMYDDNWEAFSERIRNIEVRTIVRFFLQEQVSAELIIKAGFMLFPIACSNMPG